MKQRRDFCLPICLAFSFVLGTALANAQVTYICDPSVATLTCNYLNTTIAGHYSSTFSNANASIYITYGNTGLGQSLTPFNFMTYQQYVAALSANPSPSPVQIAALSALNANDAGPYGNGNVQVRGALAAALGQTTPLVGITPAGDDCTRGTSGCYDSIVTLTNSPNITWYYIDQGGTEPSDAYDFYTTVEHETDEVLGTSSCISTTSANANIKDPTGHDLRIIRPAQGASPATSAATGTLTDYCGDGVPSAVDLFRYAHQGTLVLDSALSTKKGAYFSYDGGATKGADGVDGKGKDYNTLANEEDYADFVSSADCSTSEAVQDAEGCPGLDAGLNILNDGQGEINILNAIGYNLVVPPQLVNPNKNLIDFGEVVFPSTSPQQDGLDLKNDGSTAATIGPISIVGTYGNVSQFTFDSNCPATLDPGKKCHIDVSFNPDAVEISRAALTIPITPGSTISIPLTGMGIASTP